MLVFASPESHFVHNSVNTLEAKLPMNFNDRMLGIQKFVEIKNSITLKCQVLTTLLQMLHRKRILVGLQYTPLQSSAVGNYEIQFASASDHRQVDQLF